MKKKSKSRALEAIEAAERGKLPLSKEERAIENFNLMADFILRSRVISPNGATGASAT